MDFKEEPQKKMCLMTSDELSEKENLKVFGKCNNPNGHGHNYKLEVTLKGGVDKRTGMVLNLASLKQYIAAVVDQVDHKNLDEDVPYFKTVISTTENVCVFMWDSLKSIMPESERRLLYSVRIHETDKNEFIYFGDCTS